MRKLLTLAVAVFSLCAASQASAQGLDAKYFTVDSNATLIEDITDQRTGDPTIRPGGQQLPKPPNTPQIPGQTNPLAQVTGTIDAIDKVVNLMDKVFTLIEKNQPVVNINVNYANAVPFGTSHWTQLQGWSRPATKKYAFIIKNLYGMEVVSLTYQVHWTHSGNFKGKGKFLTGVTVEPLSVNTAWGYNVDLTAEVPDTTIANVGTTEDPIASMQVQLNWKIHTIVKDSQEKAIYYVQGDGLMQPIGVPFTRAMEMKNQKDMEQLKANLSKVSFN